MKEKHTEWLAFVARYRDGSFGRFAVDAFTLLRSNYRACDAARERQEEGSLELGEIVLVYRDRRLLGTKVTRTKGLQKGTYNFLKGYVSTNPHVHQPVRPCS